MEIMISRALRDEIVAFAAAEPEREACGLLFGTAARIDRAQACRNVARSPASSFEIDPVALIAAHKNARGGGPALIGCYHSHPNGVAAPSFVDTQSADVTMPIWIIIAKGIAAIWRFDGVKFIAVNQP